MTLERSRGHVQLRKAQREVMTDEVRELKPCQFKRSTASISMRTVAHGAGKSHSHHIPCWFLQPRSADLLA